MQSFKLPFSTDLKSVCIISHKVFLAICTRQTSSGERKLLSEALKKNPILT